MLGQQTMHGTRIARRLNETDNEIRNEYLRIGAAGLQCWRPVNTTDRNYRATPVAQEGEIGTMPAFPALLARTFPFKLESKTKFTLLRSKCSAENSHAFSCSLDEGPGYP